MQPAKLTICSYRDKVKKGLDKLGVSCWGVTLKEGGYLDFIEKEKLVYLTGDSEVELEDVTPEYFYFTSLIIYYKQCLYCWWFG